MAVPILVAILALAFATPSGTAAQIRGSEPATVTQTIDGTTITIEYFRPRTRGRSPLFGHDAVVWEDPWTPGANWSTSIRFEKPITLNGVAIPAGHYGIWMDMSEAEFLPEELVLDPNPERFHTDPPPPSDEQIRMPVTRTEGGEFKDVLTWDFEAIRSDGATLALRWGTMRIPFEIEVEPTMRRTVTAEEAALVAGTYETVFLGGPEGQGETPPFTFRVFWDEATGHLMGDMEGWPPGPDGDWFNDLDIMLLPYADRVYAFGEVYDGELWEVWPDTFFEFELAESGPSGSFEGRGEGDVVMARGRRTGG